MSSWRKLTLHALALLVFVGVVYKLPRPEPETGEHGQASLSSEDSRELWELAEARYRAHDYEGALPPLRRLRAEYPDNHLYVRRLAGCYRELGRAQDEIEHWERYVELSPRPASACARLGEAYRRLRDKPGIIDTYERCVELDPTNPEFLFFLGLGYERAHRAEEAREAYARGHELFPEYADLKVGLARILLRAGSLEEARDLGRQVVDRDPDNVDALLVLGQAYRQLGELERAKEYLNRGVRLKDTYTDFHRQLAGIARGERDRDTALFHYRKVLEHDPGDARAEARIAALLGGEKE